MIALVYSGFGINQAQRNISITLEPTEYMCFLVYLLGLSNTQFAVSLISWTWNIYLIEFKTRTWNVYN